MNFSARDTESHPLKNRRSLIIEIDATYLEKKL